MVVTSTEQENVEIVERFTEEIFNGRNYETASGIVAADCVQHGPLTGQTTAGIEALEEQWRGYDEAFSELTATAQDRFAVDDTVVTRYTYTGIHDGEFMGIPATGKSVSIDGITVNRLADGKMTETWVVADFASLLAQVGVIDLPAN